MLNKRHLLLLAALSLLAAPSSFAVESINVQTYNPSTSDHFVFIEDALRTEWPHPGKYYFGLNYNYVNNPLVASTIPVTNQNEQIISNIQTFDMSFGFKADKQLGIYFGLPVHSVNYATGNILGVTGSNTVMGDAKILAKVRLNRDDANTAWALIPEIHLPTGNTENFVSDASTYLAMRMSVERVFEKFTLGLNAGFATASNSIYRFLDPATNAVTTIDYKKRILLGIGGFVPFNDNWGMNVEYNSTIPVPFTNDLNPSELYGGLRYAATSGLALTAGGSLGKIGGSNGMDYRIIAGLRYTIADENAVVTPNPAPAPAAPAPTPAPQAKVMAAPAATPWPENTPAAAPVRAANHTPRVVLHGKKIEPLAPINFELGSDKLTLDAKDILNDVVDIIKSTKKTYKKIYIDGHTDNTGGEKANLKLSLARAKSVKKYLQSHGIKQKLVARGYGQTRPKVAYTNPDAREINRRVEFTLAN